MKKTTLQGIINLVTLIIYILYIILVGKIEKFADKIWAVYVLGYFGMLSVIMISKYVIYRRPIMIYFACIFVSYVMLILLFINNFESLIYDNFGLFVMISGIISMFFWLKGRSYIHLRFGMFAILLGLGLVILFNYVF